MCARDDEDEGLFSLVCIRHNPLASPLFFHLLLFTLASCRAPPCFLPSSLRFFSSFFFFSQHPLSSLPPSFSLSFSSLLIGSSRELTCACVHAPCSALLCNGAATDKSSTQPTNERKPGANRSMTKTLPITACLSLSL